jgi:hypothetical protein
MAEELRKPAKATKYHGNEGIAGCQGDWVVGGDGERVVLRLPLLLLHWTMLDEAVLLLLLLALASVTANDPGTILSLLKSARVLLPLLFSLVISVVGNAVAEDIVVEAVVGVSVDVVALVVVPITSLFVPSSPIIFIITVVPILAKSTLPSVQFPLLIIVSFLLVELFIILPSSMSISL